MMLSNKLILNWFDLPTFIEKLSASLLSVVKSIAVMNGGDKQHEIFCNCYIFECYAFSSVIDPFS